MEVNLTEKTTVEDAAKKEKERIMVLILKNSQDMTIKYRNLIKSKGGLLTESMTYAYSKGINDILKLITKENN